MYSNWNNVDVKSGKSGKRLDVIGIGCQQEVSIRRKEDQRGVDNVTPSGAPEKNAGLSSERIVKRGDVECGKQASEAGLAAGAAAPDLTDNAAVSERTPAAQQFLFN